MFQYSRLQRHWSSLISVLFSRCTGDLLTDLNCSDFIVKEAGKPTPVVACDHGATDHARPLIIWFVVQCNQNNKSPEDSSGFFSGKEELLMDGLAEMNQTDSVAVAHWCDDGEAKADLLPSKDRNAAVQALAEALAPIHSGANNMLGEDALRQLLGLVNRISMERSPAPLPVIIFLHEDRTGQPATEVRQLTAEMLSSSSIAYGLDDGQSSAALHSQAIGEEKEVLHILSEQSGGFYLSVHNDRYSSALQAMLALLHARYQLAIKPGFFDGRTHQITVSLTPEARKHYGDIQLRYRNAYLAAPAP
jgi:hypothetical protein